MDRNENVFYLAGAQGGDRAPPSPSPRSGARVQDHAPEVAEGGSSMNSMRHRTSFTSRPHESAGSKRALRLASGSSGANRRSVTSPFTATAATSSQR